MPMVFSSFLVLVTLIVQLFCDLSRHYMLLSCYVPTLSIEQLAVKSEQQPKGWGFSALRHLVFLDYR